MIAPSELIVNPDGSVFHLHVRPGELATTVILVGDPSRADSVAARFDKIEHRVSNREFTTITGTVACKRLSVISTGIGCDNIDIVLTEIDALFNVDFDSREPKTDHTTLTLVRLGTSGAVNPEVKIGEYLSSEFSIGIDGLAYFYDGSERVREWDREEQFIATTNWNPDLARPYVVHNDEGLLSLFDSFARRSTTISASGFYGPQGRVVRLPLSSASYLADIERAGVGNFEMEGAAIAFLGRMLSHRTLTVCAIIAQRIDGHSKPDYQKIVDKLIDLSIECLVK